MESAIRQRLAANRPSDDANSTEGNENVDELILDGCKIRTIDSEGSQFLSQFCNLTVLSLNQTTLSSITHFPALPKLAILELQDNNLRNSSFLVPLAEQVPNLEELSLAGNRLKNLEELLLLLARFNKLKVLDLELNPLVQDPLYKHAAFQSLPSLEAIDGIDRNGQEVGGEVADEEDDEEDEDNSDVDYLKNFYEADLENLDDDEDDIDFDPEGEAVDDDTQDDFDEDEDEGENEEDKDKDKTNNQGASPTKRPIDPSTAASSKRQKRGMEID